MKTAENNKMILVLPGWYPNELDAFTGDFIQRHVKAVAETRKQYLIFLVKDSKGIITKNIKTTETKSGNLTERIIYYYVPSTGVRLLDQLISHKKYIEIYKNEIKTYFKQYGLPALVHVHVAMKAGMLAVWVKKKWSIPYIVSEHWTAFLPDAKPKISDFSTIFQRQLKNVFRHASLLTVVSTVLGESIQKLLGKIEYVVIPNVVDQTIFYPARKKNTDKIQLIHISNMDYQKNVEDIIRALVIWKERGGKFELSCFGPVNQHLKELAINEGLKENIFFYGEVPQQQLSAALQQSDALILYSRYETFGCVLIEANACGVPVIVSKLKVFEQLVTENFNGLFSEGENPEALAATFISFENKRNNFNPIDIAASTISRYSFQKVAQQFVDVYENLESL